jgi:hypothetical protein
VGLIQWLEREIFFQKKHIRDTARFGSAPRGFKFIDNDLQTQVHPSAAGPNPMAQECEKILQKKST